MDGQAVVQQTRTGEPEKGNVTDQRGEVDRPRHVKPNRRSKQPLQPSPEYLPEVFNRSKLTSARQPLSHGVTSSSKSETSTVSNHCKSRKSRPMRPSPCQKDGAG